MRQFDYIVTDPIGIHARPAGLLTKAMQAFESNVTISYNGKEASCRKLLAIMSLGVKCGAAITITASGPDEDVAIKAAQDFLEANL